MKSVMAEKDGLEFPVARVMSWASRKMCLSAHVGTHLSQVNASCVSHPVS